MRNRNDRRRPFRLYPEDDTLLLAMKASYARILTLATEIKEGKPLTMQQMGAELKLPVGTIKSRLHRARAELQRGRERQDAEWLRAKGVSTDASSRE